ncbi:MAG: sulfatase-like hydrolase/transferase, partial [Verrucomicrobiae bacterium]|nr:sulfatase-like hydrolase/transferase [Verrucomicrobiae bacterium]
NVDYAGEIRNGQLDCGFDTYFGISASLDMPPYVYIHDRTPTEVATVEKAFFRKGPAGKSFEAVDVLPEFTKQAVNLIGDRSAAAKEGTPFFLYLPLNAPHTPIVPSPEWKGKSGISDYADFAMQVDWTVGQVLEALDKNGIADNTLIIFTADNGCSPAANIPQLQAAGHEPSYIYRGHKADIFEGGHRIPFLVRWPGKVKPGTKSDQLVGQFDLIATCADLLGTKLPDTAGEDSVSFLPALLGTDTGPIRDQLVSQSINGSFAIRQGKWKLALCAGSGGWSPPRPGKDDHSGLPEFQLFDVSTDPGETKNLSAEHPDRVASMKAMMEQLIARGRSTPGSDQANDVPIELLKPVPNPAKKKAAEPKKK